jgi:hypothetical protein
MGVGIYYYASMERGPSEEVVFLNRLIWAYVQCPGMWSRSRSQVDVRSESESESESKKSKIVNSEDDSDFVIFFVAL